MLNGTYNNTISSSSSSNNDNTTYASFGSDLAWADAPPNDMDIAGMKRSPVVERGSPSGISHVIS